MPGLHEIPKFMDSVLGIRRPRKEAYSSVEEEVWAVYLTGEERDTGDLVAKLADPKTLPQYKKRILDAFLSPHYEHTKNMNPAVSEWGISSRDIPDSQVQVIAAKVPQYMKEARQILDATPTNRYALGTLTKCNALIPSLLLRLPFNEAERLFENFTITDPTRAYTLYPEESDEYYPIKNLLHSDVPASYKRRAATLMHRIIEEEAQPPQKGKKGPRATDAFGHYGETLSSIVYLSHGNPERLLVDQDLFEQQIDFMLTTGVDRPIITPEATLIALDLLRSPELRRQFVGHQAVAGR